MFRLFKSEIDYFKVLLIIVIILPLSFSVLALNDIKILTQIEFMKKYFWSISIGLGIYGIVFIIWSIRRKENRERTYALLPVGLNKTSLNRWLFGISPFVLVGIYIKLVGLVLPENQIVFIDRINGQLGMMFIALATIDFSINTWNSLGAKRYNKRIIYTLLTATILILLSFGMIYTLTKSIFKPFEIIGDEVMFLIWGLLISVLSAIAFTKRKSFLE